MEYSIDCPCGRENVAEENCPVCGTDLVPLRMIQELKYKDQKNYEKEKKRRRLIFISIVSINLLIISGIMAFLLESKPEEKATIVQITIKPTATIVQPTPTPTEVVYDVQESIILVREVIKKAKIPFDIEAEIVEDKISLVGTVPNDWVKSVIVLIANESANEIEVMADKLIIEKVSDESDNKDTFIEYTIVKGDTLCGIARKLYNDSTMWQKIYDDNRDIISDPSLIYIGQVLKIYMQNERLENGE